ncbi:MAG TPA: DegQ family serine endoprotease [Verrucomicrobiae bacterium]|nr:DegQ family serine endoprotease [Verrucomicrobiae bacterium]
MNPRKLQAIGITLGVALFVATGLLVFTGADQPVPTRDRTGPSAADGDTAALRQLGNSFGEIAARVGPSVVTIYSEKVLRFQRPEFPFPFGDDSPFGWFFGDQDSPERHPHPPRQREYRFSQRGLGSGIIIDKAGHILTNNHVVKDVDEIKIILADKREFVAEIVGTDPKTDIAVIKIKGNVPRDLSVATLGDSDDVRVGDWVLAIGAPFGYAQTLTHGIISAKGRNDVGGSDTYEDFLQTDAPINPGNSGGPLVNLRGEVIGINTMIATSIGQFQGVSFAIPINMARDVMNDLLTTGRVRRGLLGVIIQGVDQDLAHQFGLPDNKGALVSQVNKDSPAEKAGIRVGDLIVRYNGKQVDDTHHLRNLVAATAPGTRVEVTVVRNGKQRTLTVTIGELASGQAAGEGENEESKSTADLGLTVAPVTADAAKRYNLDETDKGVVVTDVDDDSPAADAGLRPGDLVTEVDRRAVASVDDFREAVTKTKGKDGLLMLVKRDGTSRFVILRPKSK